MSVILADNGTANKLISRELVSRIIELVKHPLHPYMYVKETGNIEHNSLNKRNGTRLKGDLRGKLGLVS